MGVFIVNSVYVCAYGHGMGIYARNVVIKVTTCGNELKAVGSRTVKFVFGQKLPKRYLNYSFIMTIKDDQFKSDLFSCWNFALMT